MSTAGRRFPIFFMAVFFLSASFSWAADAKMQEQKLQTLKERLNQLKALHVKMLENQSEIKKELEELKIWIRRHP